MDDLRQILRYEIPGIITIIYFLALFYPVLIEHENQFTNILRNPICQCEISNFLLGLSASIVALGLPVGLLVYEFYLFVEHENFLLNRDAFEDVRNILVRFEEEQRWWIDPDRHLSTRDIRETPPLMDETKHLALRNEILDAAFFNRGERTDIMDLVNLSSRFQHYYHSARVIGIYAPLSAVLFAGFLALIFIEFSVKEYIFSLITIFICIFIIYFLKYDRSISFCNIDHIWRWLYERPAIQYWVYNGLIISIPIFFISLNSLSITKLIIILIVVFISLMIISPTRKDGYLRREMVELERNILLLKREEIIRIIRERIDWNFEQI